MSRCRTSPSLLGISCEEGGSHAPADVEEQSHMSECFMAPGGLLQSLSCGQQPLFGSVTQRPRQSACLDRRRFHRCKKGVFEGSASAWKRCQGFLTGLAHLPFSYQHLEGLHSSASSAWLPSALLVHSQPSALLAANEVIQRLCQPPGAFVKRGVSGKLFSSHF